MVFNKNKCGLTVNIRLTPNARRTAICGIIKVADDQMAIKISINVVPEEGKANKALIAFLSKTWRFSKSSISLLSGTSSRIKTILIEGDFDEIKRQILEKSPNLFD